MQRKRSRPADARDDDCRDVGGGEEHAAEHANQRGELDEDETRNLEVICRQRSKLSAVSGRPVWPRAVRVIMPIVMPPIAPIVSA